MRRLTLDEAIQHCLEKSDCSECGQEHTQLAEWLKELKQLRQNTFDVEAVVKEFEEAVFPMINRSKAIEIVRKGGVK